MLRFIKHGEAMRLPLSTRLLPPNSSGQFFSRALTNHKNHDHNSPAESFVYSNDWELSLAQFNPTPYILNQIVSSCAKWGSVCEGIQLHSTIIKLGFSSNLYICSALIDMYGKCGVISNAKQLFDEMPHRNIVSWNSLISGYVHVHCSGTAIELFIDMLREGFLPTPFTVSAVFVACSQLKVSEIGLVVRSMSVKLGFCSNVVVGTGLIDMYSKNGDVEDARRVFDQMVDKNDITWTCMVTGYSQNKKPSEGMMLVKEMLGFGLKPNCVTYNSLLSSFCSPVDSNHGKQCHCRVILEGFESNVYLVVSLMSLYSECSSNLEDFRKICSGVTKWDQILWNGLITGFANLGSGNEALKSFCAMRQEGFNVDLFTFTSILKATGIISAIEEGKQIHGLVFKTGYISNLHVQNGFVSMYAQCGAVYDSKRAFFDMKEYDLISWNSLLSGFAHHGHGTEAVELFEHMIKAGIKPDSTTYLLILSACRHTGLLEKGLQYFHLMRSDDSLDPPKVEHYASIVDLYSRAGYLHEAEAFVKTMPIEPGSSVFKALLSASQVYGNIEIAERSAKELLKLNPDDPATYVLLSHVFRTEGMFDYAAKVRKLMCERGVKKEPGYSQI